MKTVEGNEKEELQDLQERLESKIRVCAANLFIPTFRNSVLCYPSFDDFIMCLV